MSTDLKRSPGDEARDLIAEAIREDGREQKDIAAQAGMSSAHLTNLKLGSRSLTHRQARKLARTWPHRADELLRVAERVEDAASLRPGTTDPGQLRRLTTIALRSAGCRTSVLTPAPALVAA